MSIGPRASLVILVLWVVGSGFAADADSRSSGNVDLSTMLELRLARSSKIVIHHIPNIAIGYRLRERENIRNDWKYRIEINCVTSCAGRTHSSLKRFVLEAKKQAHDCPIPLNTLIMAVDEDNNTTLELYIHQSGQCLVLDGQSYFSTYRFDPIVEFSKI